MALLYLTNKAPLPVQSAKADRPTPINLPLELTTHQSGMSTSIFTRKPASQLTSITAYLHACIRSERCCPLCGHQHTVPKICFSSEDRNIIHLELLRDILDNSVLFNCTEEGHQELIFLLCHYFLVDQDYCFPYFIAHYDMTTSNSMNSTHTCPCFSS